MLKIEDVKVGDAIIHKETGVEYKVQMFLSGDQILLVGGEIANDLKYFKKKEQSQYTFDDLIDVARKAFDDGVLQGYAVEHKLTKSLSVKFSDTKVLTWCLGDDDYSIPIGHIQSLYKETFVIECEEDSKRIKHNAKLTLTNDVALTAIRSTDYGVLFEEFEFAVSHMVLKGATVEQERGRDD